MNSITSVNTALLPTLQSADSSERFGVVPISQAALEPTPTEDIHFVGFEATVDLEDVVRNQLVAEGVDTKQFRQDMLSRPVSSKTCMSDRVVCNAPVNTNIPPIPMLAGIHGVK